MVQKPQRSGIIRKPYYLLNEKQLNGAGVKIKSMTTIKDMVLYSDYIESKAEAVLLPGYNILDMGYSADGTYQVVLIGKVKTVSEGIDSKELRYAKRLMDRGEKAKAKRIITDIIENSKDNNAVAEAMYCQVLWKFASDQRDTFEKLKAYYPNSKYVSRLKTLLDERERKRKEEERKRIEAERKRKAEDRKRIEAQRKRKAEIERKKEEEECKRIEAERKRKEEERKRIEAERRRKVEEARKRKVERERLESIWGKGALRKEGRYILYSSGRVLDINTDLEWYPGPDKNTTWDEAKRWVANLNVDGGGWRMPTGKELWSLYQKGAGVYGMRMTSLLATTPVTIWSGETGATRLYPKAVLQIRFGEYATSEGVWVSPSYYKHRRGFAARSRR